jgi:predicted dehydrogenase/threonine dehydrogenase-like Zn-dependent dehydrogenase
VKQIAQKFKDGRIRVVDVPPPELDEWKVLVRTRASLVSAGTERAKVEVGRESLLGKARHRPDQVRQVVEKVRADGVGAAVDAVRNRLEALSPLGYCAAGTVVSVGARVRGLSPGDVVACGGDAAAHAELLAVPGNLCVSVPAHVPVRDAAFTTLGSIALHGFRQADARLGDRVAVVGLGLVGQLTARIARAAGCEVLGVDLDDWRIEHAERAGVLDVGVRRDRVFRDELGSCDVVIVTAAAAGSNDPVSLATDLARERGTIVVVGDVLLHLDRRRLYEKELELRLARSYGPGRYDDEYEERGLDYPLPYVRWTERRNMGEFVRLLADERIAVADLVTHSVPIEEADRAFEVLTDPRERAFAVVIDYAAVDEAPEPAAAVTHRPFSTGNRVGFIGAGGFAQRLLIPLARRHQLVLDRVATESGLSARSAADRFEFARGACSVDELLADPALAGVFIATRHDRHAELTRAALAAGKAVFVEKPLCVTEEELNALRRTLLTEGAPPLMVGFNRRFAPATVAVRKHLAAAAGPTNVLVRVNTKWLAADAWPNDPDVGGGRLIGEGCHFLDLIADIVGAPPVAVLAQGRAGPGEPIQTAQDFSVSVRFGDGSLGMLLYSTAGAAGVGKELVEVHRGERSARIDDFRSVRVWGGRLGRTRSGHKQDKGHDEEVARFARVLRGEEDAPPAESYLISAALTLAAVQSLQSGCEIRLESDPLLAALV